MTWPTVREVVRSALGRLVDSGLRRSGSVPTACVSQGHGTAPWRIDTVHSRPGTVLARRASSARSFPRDGRSRGALFVTDMVRSQIVYEVLMITTFLLSTNLKSASSMNRLLALCDVLGLEFYVGRP